MPSASGVPIELREVRHFHLFCGLGAGARGFNRGTARVGNMQAVFRCLGGVDVNPAAIRDFNKLAGVPGTVLDLFDAEQYAAFHGAQPPAGWRAATPQDIQAAAGHERPHIVFLSAPCKGFSGLLAEGLSRTDKYQALNRLTLRGVWLMLEAFQDDPPELVVFENVPRIATRGRALLDRIGALLRHHGYAVAETNHDCGELGGLAQSRKRFLLVARHQLKVPPFLYEPPKRALRAVGEVLERLPLPGDVARAGAMHRVPSLQWQTWVRLAFVEAGSDWRSLNRLRIEDGHLADFRMTPEVDWHAGVLGVRPWDEACGTITGNARPVTGAYSVADPRRAAGVAAFGQYGVKGWDECSQAVIGKAAVGAGNFAVADPRHGGPEKFNNVYRVVAWNKHAAAVTSSRDVAVADPRAQDTRFHNAFKTVAWTEPSQAITGQHAPSNGAMCVADPRSPSTHEGRGKYRVTEWQEASGAVIAASTTGNGAFAVADPRTGWPDGAHQSKLRVHRYGEPAHTVTGSDRVASGAMCVADPSTDERRSGAIGVLGWQEANGAVAGESLPSNGAFAVADPRPGMSREAGDAYLTAGHYGVVPWTEPTGAVSAAGQHDNGKWSVADPRIPAATDRLVAVIRSTDDTWHRPFTTLELAALQGMVDPEEQLELDGLSDQDWRERIGNAVPPDSAAAIASTMGKTLLLAWSGEGFLLSAMPIWVQPVAVALSVRQAGE